MTKYYEFQDHRHRSCKNPCQLQNTRIAFGMLITVVMKTILAKKIATRLPSDYKLTMTDINDEILMPKAAFRAHLLHQ